MAFNVTKKFVNTLPAYRRIRTLSRHLCSMNSMENANKRNPTVGIISKCSSRIVYMSDIKNLDVNGHDDCWQLDDLEDLRVHLFFLHNLIIMLCLCCGCAWQSVSLNLILNCRVIMHQKDHFYWNLTWQSFYQVNQWQVTADTRVENVEG